MNEIQFLHEKEGGNPRPQQYMHAFQAAIEDCELRDMEYVGDQFTWFRGRIRERLDRGLVNDAWSTLYPHAALQNLNYNNSDNRPLCVDTEYYSGVAANGAASKKFEVRRLHEQSFSDVVEEAWNSASAAPEQNTVYEKLNRMHDQFHVWDQSVLKKPKKRLRKARRELEKIMSGPMNDESELKRKELSELIEFLLELEEIHVMQRSRAEWLKHGDRNTSFFQAFASARHKKNLIKKINDDQGNVMEGT